MNCRWLRSLVILLSLFLTVELINPACECVIYQSYGKGLSKGIFNSPDYPSAYPGGMDCVLFSFIGNINETVKIDFIAFDLKPKIGNESCKDFLKIYLNEEGAHVNEQSVYNYNLCGDLKNMPQTTFYSRGRSIHLEFHTSLSIDGGNSTGFKGIYSFLDAGVHSKPDVLLCTCNIPAVQFLNTGEKDSNKCSFRFYSTRGLTGQFFSPYYPQNYPPNSTCLYKFYGQIGYSIKFTFRLVQLQNNTSCNKKNDYIEVIDETGPIDLICGSKSELQVNISSPNARVRFYSDHSSQKKGFAAKYEFVPVNRINNGPSSSRPTCNESFYHVDRHGNEQNQTIQSPKHPHPYPPSKSCYYDFHGKPGEQIQIKFTHFNLHGRMNKLSCANRDRVTIYIGSPSDPQEVDEYCGTSLPPQHMSKSNWTRVRFISHAATVDRDVSGFAFQYKFRTDFGITSGKQKNFKNGDPRCMFEYNSTNEKTGNFTSPNYPGKYMLNVRCEYVFLGERGQKVEVGFPEFDVGKDSACQSTDHVTFTNFRHEGPDKDFNPMCGQLDQTMTTRVSDGAYFRVIFQSYGGYFDGRGFLGRYQFHDQAKSSTLSPRPISSNNSSSLHFLSSIYIALLTLHTFYKYFIR